MVVQASTKHQVVIPKEVWLKLELSPKQRFLVEVENGMLSLKPLPSSWSQLRGSAKHTFKKLGGGKNFITNERKQW